MFALPPALWYFDSAKWSCRDLLDCVAVATAFATCNYDKSSRFECDALWQGQTAHQLIPFPAIMPPPPLQPIGNCLFSRTCGCSCCWWGLVRQKCISSDIYEVRRVCVLGSRCVARWHCPASHAFIVYTLYKLRVCVLLGCNVKYCH